MSKSYFVYIVANHSRRLYAGITSNLTRRAFEHRNKTKPGFASRYDIGRLVYFEETNDVEAAIAREKHIKGWKRERKIALIESVNPGWADLSRG